MHGDELAHALGGSRAGVGGGLHGTHVAADEDGHEAAADLLFTHEGDVCGLDHGVGSLDGADQSTGLDHAEGLGDVSHSCYLLSGLLGRGRACGFGSGSFLCRSLDLDGRGMLFDLALRLGLVLVECRCRSFRFGLCGHRLCGRLLRSGCLCRRRLGRGLLLGGRRGLCGRLLRSGCRRRCGLLLCGGSLCGSFSHLRSCLLDVLLELLAPTGAGSTRCHGLLRPWRRAGWTRRSRRGAG